MGLLDRFKKDNGPAGSPDALTREALARVRAVPGVDGVEATDADTLAVRWEGHAEPSALSLVDIRAPWTSARGFDRIEVMDDFIAQLSPPAPSEAPADPASGELPGSHPGPLGGDHEVARADARDAGAWEAVRNRLRPVMSRPGAPDDTIVRWPLGGVLEVTVVVDGGPSLPLTMAELADWGVDEAAVRSAVQENQSAIDPGLDPIAPDQPAWVPTRPADHLASWLCAPERVLWAAGLDAAIVLAPLPTELVVVDPAAAPLVESILTSTRTIVAEEPGVLWPAPFLVRPGSVEPWTPDTDHPCAALVAEMRALAPD